MGADTRMAAARAVRHVRADFAQEYRIQVRSEEALVLTGRQRVKRPDLTTCVTPPCTLPLAESHHLRGGHVLTRAMSRGVSRPKCDLGHRSRSNAAPLSLSCLSHPRLRSRSHVGRYAELKRRQLVINEHFQHGELPGVPPGARFFCRAEMQAVGLHQAQSKLLCTSLPPADGGAKSVLSMIISDGGPQVLGAHPL